MTNLEVMDKAVSFTKGAWMKAYYSRVQNGNISYGDLEEQAIEYSSQALCKVLNSENGMCSDYTRTDNLRYDMANLGKDSIKTELLKNVVNVATFHKMNDTIFGNHIGTVITDGMSSDQVAVVLFNDIAENGVESGYNKLSDSMALESVCKVFSRYRTGNMKQTLDNISKTNSAAMYVNNEIDTYYARYGDRPKGVDTTVLNQQDDPGYGGK